MNLLDLNHKTGKSFPYIFIFMADFGVSYQQANYKYRSLLIPHFQKCHIKSARHIREKGGAELLKILLIRLPYQWHQNELETVSGISLYFLVNIWLLKVELNLNITFLMDIFLETNSLNPLSWPTAVSYYFGGGYFLVNYFFP